MAPKKFDQDRLKKDLASDVADVEEWAERFHSLLSGDKEEPPAIEEDLNNLLDSRGYNLIHGAVITGYYSVLKKLAKHYNIDVNKQSRLGDTPLHRAAFEGNAECARLLVIDLAASVNIENNRKWTPLHMAAANGYKEIVELLCQKDDCELDAQDNDGNTPLHLAAYRGHDEVVGFLKRRCCRIDIKNKLDEVPADMTSRRDIQTMLGG